MATDCYVPGPAEPGSTTQAPHFSLTPAPAFLPNLPFRSIPRLLAQTVSIYPGFVPDPGDWPLRKNFGKPDRLVLLSPVTSLPRSQALSLVNVSGNRGKKGVPEKRQSLERKTLRYGLTHLFIVN